MLELEGKVDTELLEQRLNDTREDVEVLRLAVQAARLLLQQKSDEIERLRRELNKDFAAMFKRERAVSKERGATIHRLESLVYALRFQIVGAYKDGRKEQRAEDVAEFKDLVRHDRRYRQPCSSGPECVLPGVMSRTTDARHVS